LNPREVRGAIVETKTLLIPPPGFPVSDDPITETVDGYTTLIREDTGDRARNIIRLGGVTPGHMVGERGTAESNVSPRSPPSSPYVSRIPRPRMFSRPA